MDGWSFGLQLNPLSGLQDCLAALAWTARIQNSGLASPSPAAIAPSDDKEHVERVAGEQHVEAQSVSTSERLINGTGELDLQTREPTSVRENGLLPVKPAKDSGLDCLLRVLSPEPKWTLLSRLKGYSRPPLPVCAVFNGIVCHIRGLRRQLQRAQ